MFFPLFAKLDFVLGKKPPTIQTQNNANKQNQQTLKPLNQKNLHKKVKQINLST